MVAGVRCMWMRGGTSKGGYFLASDLPEDRDVLCAISFGYPDTDHPANSFRTERAELGDIYDPRG